MPESLQREEEFAEELLSVLRDDVPEPPERLSDKTIRTVQALMTSRDMIDLMTVVFLLRFCTPLLELIAAAFGSNLTHQDRTRGDEDE